MRYSLDADTCIEHLRNRRKGLPCPVSQRLASLRQDDVVICSIVRGELLYGAEKSPFRTRDLLETHRFLAGFPTLPFDDAAAADYGRIFADLEQRGLRIGLNDMLIAAIAIAGGLTLVTHNTREFSRISGLLLEDWQS